MKNKHLLFSPTTCLSGLTLKFLKNNYHMISFNSNVQGAHAILVVCSHNRTVDATFTPFLFSCHSLIFSNLIANSCYIYIFSGITY